MNKIKNRLVKKVKSKRGAELIESMVLVAVVVTVALTLFYPMLGSVLESVSSTVQEKFLSTMDLLN